MIAIACASQRGGVAQLQASGIRPGRARRRRSAPCSAGSSARSCRRASSSLASSHRRLDRAERLGQALGDLLERVGEVAVVVERLDQHQHRGRVVGATGACRASCARRWSCRLGDGCRGRCALEVVAVVVAAARPAGRLADAVEVVALGAVLPVVALGAAELGALSIAGRLVAGVAAVAPRRRSASRSPPRSAGAAARRSGSNARRRLFLGARGTGSARASARLPGAARASTAAAAGSTAAAAASAPDAATGGPAGRVSSSSEPRALHAEVLAEVDLADVGVVDDLVRACLRRAPGPR